MAGALMQNKHEEIVKVKKKRRGGATDVIIMEINKFPSNYTFYRMQRFRKYFIYARGLIGISSLNQTNTC